MRTGIKRSNKKNFDQSIGRKWLILESAIITIIRIRDLILENKKNDFLLYKGKFKVFINTIGIDYKKMTIISQDIEKQNFEIDLDIIKITKIALKRNINLYNESFEEIC